MRIYRAFHAKSTRLEPQLLFSRKVRYGWEKVPRKSGPWWKNPRKKRFLLKEWPEYLPRKVEQFFFIFVDWAHPPTSRTPKHTPRSRIHQILKNGRSGIFFSVIFFPGDLFSGIFFYLQWTFFPGFHVNHVFNQRFSLKGRLDTHTSPQNFSTTFLENYLTGTIIKEEGSGKRHRDTFATVLFLVSFCCAGSEKTWSNHFIFISLALVAGSPSGTPFRDDFLKICWRASILHRQISRSITSSRTRKKLNTCLCLKADIV